MLLVWFILSFQKLSPITSIQSMHGQKNGFTPVQFVHTMLVMKISHALYTYSSTRVNKKTKNTVYFGFNMQNTRCGFGIGILCNIEDLFNI